METTIILHPRTKKQVELFRDMAAALKIPFKEKEESTYNPEFVAKIKRSEKNFSEGKFTKIKTADLWK